MPRGPRYATKPVSAAGSEAARPKAQRSEPQAVGTSKKARTGLSPKLGNHRPTQGFREQALARPPSDNLHLETFTPRHEPGGAGAPPPVDRERYDHRAGSDGADRYGQSRGGAGYGDHLGAPGATKRVSPSQHRSRAGPPCDGRPLNRWGEAGTIGPRGGDGRHGSDRRCRESYLFPDCGAGLVIGNRGTAFQSLESCAGPGCKVVLSSAPDGDYPAFRKIEFAGTPEAIDRALAKLRSLLGHELATRLRRYAPPSADGHGVPRGGGARSADPWGISAGWAGDRDHGRGGRSPRALRRKIVDGGPAASIRGRDSARCGRQDDYDHHTVLPRHAAAGQRSFDETRSAERPSEQRVLRTPHDDGTSLRDWQRFAPGSRGDARSPGNERSPGPSGESEQQMARAGQSDGNGNSGSDADPPCICGKPGVSVCAQCESVFYCSRECQATDWGSHQLVCKAPGQFAPLYSAPKVPATESPYMTTRNKDAVGRLLTSYDVELPSSPLQHNILDDFDDEETQYVAVMAVAPRVDPHLDGSSDEEPGPAPSEAAPGLSQNRAGNERW